jgi:glutathione S-transferase
VITLHYNPGNASLFPHILLRELGVPFELAFVDRDKDAQSSAAYLALNPHGKIPVLVDGDLVLFETMAIGLHLADAYPAAGLAPPPGDPLRPLYYRWMAQITNTLQSEFRAWFYPHEFTTDPAGVDAVQAAVGDRVMGAFERLDAQLGDGPWLLGETLSAADFYLLMMTRWGRTLPRPARDLPHVGAHARRLLARPAVAEALRVEGLPEPWI